MYLCLIKLVQFTMIIAVFFVLAIPEINVPSCGDGGVQYASAISSEHFPFSGWGVSARIV